MSYTPGPYSPFGAPQVRPFDDQLSTGHAVARFFNTVYAWMSAGLALTAVVGWYVAGRPDILVNVGRGGMLLLLVVQIGLVVAVGGAVNRISTSVATLLFMLFAGLNGVTLATLFFVYAHATIASAFAITAGTFGAMSLYGFFTRRDLSSWRSILMMGVIGIFIASIVSIFWHNSMFSVILNYVGVLVFVGLTAYDTQQLKAMAVQTSGNTAFASRLAISGALWLYLDFYNMFIFILRIMGGRRD